MIRKFAVRPLSFSAWTHGAFAVASIIGFMVVKPILDASYAASGHPVDYAAGQLAFAGDTIKEYYAKMLASGTLDIYWKTQFIDFAFISAVFCLGWFFCTAVARLGRSGSWGWHAGIIAAVSAMGGAVSDAAENLLSFVMLSNPSGFPNWIAFIYSSFAAVKFTLITAAMGTVVLSFALICVGRLLRRPWIG